MTIVVDMLRERGDEAAVRASNVFRPSGFYQTTNHGNPLQTKHIAVEPGARLSH